MKITKIETIKLSSVYGDGKVFGQPKSVKTVVYVLISTNSKIQGIGETYAGVYVPETIEIIVKFLSSFLIGLDPLDINTISKNINLPFVGSNGLIKSVLSALEIAIFDIASKYKKIPMYKLINNNYRKNINVYASGGSVIFTPDQIKKDLNEILKKDFKAYKMRIGYQSLKNDIKRITIAKNILQKKKLMVDAIMGTLKPKWDILKAKKNIKELIKHDLTWIEEPLDPNDFFSYQKLCSLNYIPMAFGESFTSFNEFEIAIRLNCCNVIQPDVTHCGINDAIKIIKIAKINKVKIAMHSWGSPISTLSNLHFALAFSNIDWMEIPYVTLDLLKDEFNSIHQIKNGKISLDENIVGLGLSLNNKTLLNNKFVKNSGYKIKN